MGMWSRRHLLAFLNLVTVTLLFLLAANTSHATVIRGLLVYAHETRTHQPCGDLRIFWARAAGRPHQQLLIEYHNLVKNTYAAVYAEIDGDFVDQRNGVFARDYDGAIEIRELQQMSRESVDACRSNRGTPPTFS